MKMISNKDIIHQWSSMPPEVVAAFGDEGDFSRQFLLTPTLFALLGDVSDKQVLDAGCGNGYLTRLLAKQGATVTGLEPATPLFHFALNQEAARPLGIHYVQADLSTWRDALRFDWVIANMVLMDIPDFEAAFDTCFFHLRPGGHLLFSISHPCFEATDNEFLANGHITVKEYFRVHPIE